MSDKDKKDGTKMEYTKIKHKGEEAWVFNDGKTGKLRITPFSGCEDFYPNVACTGGEPPVASCPSTHDAECDGDVVKCVCAEPG